MARLRRDLLASLLGQGWAVAIGLLFVPFFVSRLGVDGYGLIALLPLFAALYFVLDCGLAITMDREMARLKSISPATASDTAWTIVVAHLALGVPLAVAVTLVLPAVGPQWLRHEGTATTDLQRTLHYMALALTLQWPVPLLQHGLMGLGRQTLVNGILAAHATALNIGAALLVVHYQPSVPTYFQWASLCAVVHVAVLGLAFKRSLPAAPGPVRVTLARLRHIASFSGGAAGIGLTSVLITHVDRLLASRFLSLEQFGYYSIAATLGRSVHLLIAPIHSALFPRLTALAGGTERAALANLYALGTQTMSVAILPLAAVIVWMDFELAYGWLGDAAVAAGIVGIAGFIAAGSALNGLMHVPFALQLAHGKTRPGLAISIGLLLVSLPSAILLFEGFGPIGLAATWLVLNALYAAVGVPLTHRITRLGTATRWVRDEVALPLVAAFGSVGLLHMFIGHGTSRFASLAIVALALGIGYLAAIVSASRVRTALVQAARKELKPGP
jgi:O-antigen/teichoic acid export membrane protein